MKNQDRRGMLWSASTVAKELDLPSPKAARSLMESLEVPAIFLGPGRGRGFRWHSDDVLRAIKAREIIKTLPKKNIRREKTIFNQGLTVKEQMAALYEQSSSSNSKKSLA